VFVLRGCGYLLSPGLAGLAAQLRQCGFRVEDLPSGADGRVCEELVCARNAGRLCGPVILLGHSRGGRHALHAARALQETGITVDLLILLDVGDAPPVPANVKRVLNIYLRHSFYHSGPVCLAPCATACVENIDLKSCDTPKDGRGVHHITIAANPAVRDLVLERIRWVAEDHP
jgi:hypothetical protein